MATTHILRAATAALVVLALALAGVLTVQRVAGAQESAPFNNLERLAAGNFVDAGVGVSQLVYPGGGAASAVLATTANFPDALASTALAGKQNGPVLFTDPENLSAATAAELDRILGPGATVYLMGGTVAISENVRQQVEGKGYRTRRVSGPTRVETAVEAARVTGLPEDGTVLIARAFGGPANSTADRTTGWVDSTSCGGFAARAGVPVLLTETGRLSTPTANALGQLGARRAVVCGGSVAVSDAVLESLRQRGLTVTRVSGATRVLTAEAVARQLFGFASAAGQQVIIVNGYDQNFGHGLAASALSRVRNAPILFVNTNEPTACGDTAHPSRATLCYLETAGTDTARVTVVGATTLVSQAVADAAAQAAGGRRVPPLPAPGGVSVADDINDDGTRLTVRWNPVPDPDGVLRGYNVYIGTGGQAGQRFGGMPTVAGNETSIVVTGLQKDTAYTVAVTAVDTIGRESARSGTANATTADEVPTPVRDFTATVGNQRVRLQWAASPEPDVTGYRLQRSTSQPVVGCQEWNDLPPVQGRGTGSYDDTGLNNGTGYCYRIRSIDAAGQTPEEWVMLGPVTPTDVGVSVDLIEPKSASDSNRITLHYGSPVRIRYEVASTVVPVSEVRIRVEWSTQGGATGTYTTIVDQAHGVSTAERTLEWNGLPDEDISNAARLRITASAAGAFDSDNSNSMDVSRAPSPVRTTTATPGASSITLAWNESPEFTVAGYEVHHARVDTLPGSTEPENCTRPGVTYAQVGSDVTPRSTTTFTHTGLSNSSVQAHCYRVRALRLLPGGERRPGPFGPTVLARPGTTASPSVELLAPANNTAIERGTTFPIRYRVTVPSGATTHRVELEYCVHYTPSTMVPPAPAACHSGWVTITNSAPATAGEHTVNWSVPNNIAQGDNDRGAVRAMVFESAQATQPPSTGGTSLRSGIRFY